MSGLFGDIPRPSKGLVKRGKFIGVVFRLGSHSFSRATGWPVLVFDRLINSPRINNVRVCGKLAHTQAAGWIILPHVRATPIRGAGFARSIDTRQIVGTS